MKWNLNTFDSKTLIYYHARSMGLAPFDLNNNNFTEPRFFNKIFTVIIVAVNSIFMIFYYPEHVKIRKDYDIDAVRSFARMLIVFESYACANLIPIAFLIMHKKVLNLMIELRNVSKDFKNLGVEENQEKLMKNITITSFMVNFIISLISSIFYFHVNGHASNVWYYYTYRDLINTNSILIFVQILIYVGNKFELINKKLDKNFHSEIKIKHNTLFRVNRIIDRDQSQGYYDEAITDIQRVYKIEAIHLKLCDILRRSINLFAVPIILNSCRILCEFVYFFYRIHNSLEQKKFATAWYYLLCVFSPCLEISLMSYASDAVCRKGNAIRVVLSRLWNKTDSVKVGKEFFMFSLQLLHNPVSVRILGFLVIDYSFAYKVLCAMITYAVVIIQLDPNNRNTEA